MTVLAVLQFLSATMCLLVSVIGIGAALVGGNGEGTLLLGCAFLAVAGLQVACGIGLWKLKSYGRTIQLVLSWIGLIGFPVGTVVSIIVLLYLRKPGIKLLFSGRSATQLTTDERAQVVAVSEGSMGVVLAVVLVVFVGIVVAGIVAAIAIPGLLRARMSGNEAVAIGTMRTINSAQASYYQQCEGYAPSLLELENAGEFLPPNLSGSVTVTRSGYSITVEPAGTASLVQDPPPGCAGTVTDFFAHADPLTPGTTGTRHFATDARGTIYQSEGRMADTDGAMPVQ